MISEVIQQQEPKAVDVPDTLEAAPSKADAPEDVAIEASAEVTASQPSADAEVEIPEAKEAGTKRPSDINDDALASKASKADE